MRLTLGVLTGLVLAVTVAVAQPPAPRERAAVLKPPVPLQPDQIPPVARGVAEEFPATSASLGSTPVSRPGGNAGRPAAGVATGPAWLSGVDPNVLPAAGLGSKGATVRPLTPPTSMTKDESTPQPKFLDRFKPTSGDKQPAPQTLPQQLTQSPGSGIPQRPGETPTANTPFRGTGNNGSPVYAGPPAYRWYGWGTVTPGANPLAPTGQYPKASANWYSITGATPGAFPVAVSNDVRVMPGTEPPTYGLARTTLPTVPSNGPIIHQPQPRPQPSTMPQPQSNSLPRPEVPKLNPANDTKFPPGTSVGSAIPAPILTPPAPAPVSVPTIAPPPGTKPVAVAPPMPPAPDTVAVKPPVMTPAIPPVQKPEPVAVLPPLPAIPVVPPVMPAVEPAKPTLPTDPKTVSTEPKPLPTSVTTEPPREEQRWKTAPEPLTPAPGTWTPAQGMQPLPTQPVEQPSSWQQGNATVKPVVARGQMNDNPTDPVATLVKQMCQGRADGVEVRWTGTKKLQVCFEIRTAAEAHKLVADISKRPELTAYQIDFCVFVK